MTAERRLKMELGTRDEDVRNDESRGGILQRTPRAYKSHPFRHQEYICAYPDDSCHATLAKEERDGHRAWHRRHAEWDVEWQELVERQADVIERQDTRIIKLEGQVEVLTELFGRAMGRGIDAILADEEPA